MNSPWSRFDEPVYANEKVKIKCLYYKNQDGTTIKIVPINLILLFFKGEDMTDYKSFFEEIKNKVLSLIEEASSIEEITEIKNKYLSKKGIKNSLILKEFDYENQGFRGLDKYIKKKKMKVR